MPYTILSHTADTGIEATADSRTGLIGELARGMFCLMAEPVPCIAERQTEIVVASGSPEDLVVDALSELLYEAESTDTLFCGFKVTSVGEGEISVKAWGSSFGKVDLSGPPIKAVTYHDLVVTETDTGWRGRVYFDV